MTSYPTAALLLVILLVLSVTDARGQRDDGRFIDPQPFTENPLDIAAACGSLFIMVTDARECAMPATSLETGATTARCGPVNG